jgi:hypothetical protein
MTAVFLSLAEHAARVMENASVERERMEIMIENGDEPHARVSKADPIPTFRQRLQTNCSSSTALV